jgi:hypothetical protein
VDNHTADSGHLYAIRFSSGTVKVGRTSDLAKRIAAHVANAAIHEVAADCIWVSQPVPQLAQREADLLAFCASRWEIVAGGEYFRRADIAAIIERANGAGIPTQEVRGSLVTVPSPRGISDRATELRAAIEGALQTHAYAVVAPGCTRIYVPAPAPDNPRWDLALAALRTADRWGSSGTAGTPEIWAEIHDEVSA